MVVVMVTLLVSLRALLVALVVSFLELVVGLVVLLAELVVSSPPLFALLEIFPFIFSIKTSLPLLPASTRFGFLSFVTFYDVLSMFVLRYK